MTYAERYHLEGAIDPAMESTDEYWRRLSALDGFFGTTGLERLASSGSGRERLRSVIARHAPRSVSVPTSARRPAGPTGGSTGGSSAAAAATGRGRERASLARAVATRVSRDETPLVRREYQRIQEFLADEDQTLRSLEAATPPNGFSPPAEALYRYVRLFRMIEIRERIETERERTEYARDDERYVEQAIRFAGELLGRPGVYSGP